jgi:hypothetical protein
MVTGVKRKPGEQRATAPRSRRFQLAAVELERNPTDQPDSQHARKGNPGKRRFCLPHRGFAVPERSANARR